MHIAILLALVPTLAFYFYVLVQFMKEAARRRNHDTCALIVPLHSENARHANYSVREFRAQQNGAATARDRGRTDSARAEIIVTQVKNRLAACAAGPARLAAKGAAKG
jgi:hypothetical protein